MNYYYWKKFIKMGKIKMENKTKLEPSKLNFSSIINFLLITLKIKAFFCMVKYYNNYHE
jgi:hypothetical protein